MSVRAWRIHKQRYEPADATGSLIVSGRYHRGADDFPADRTWAALYTSLAPEVSLAELMRHSSADTLPYLDSYRLAEFEIDLHSVVDCTKPALLGLTFDDLAGDLSYRHTQDLGEAAFAIGLEGIRAPPATRLCDNLIIFPANLSPSSQVAVVSSRDPRLMVEP